MTRASDFRSRMWALAVAALAGTVANAGAVSLETTLGRGYLAASLSGELELRAEETYLTLTYGFSKPPRIEAGTEATSVEPLSPVAQHQFGAGIDHALSRSWYLTGMLSASPRAVDRIPFRLAELGVTDPRLPADATLLLIASRQSLGATAGVAYDSAGLSDLEYSADLSATATRHWLGRGVVFPGRLPWSSVEALDVLRPSVGALLLWKLDTELSIRGSFFWYSKDPVIAGRFTEGCFAEQSSADATQGSACSNAALLLSQAMAANHLLEGRFSQADAVSGFASAPVLVELRASVTHRFSSLVKGQLSFTFDRYVPGQGYGQVLSTKWTLKPSEAWRIWAALALQRDEPLDDPRSRTPSDPKPMSSGLLTVGAELSF
ncbi:MAG: hypothetical protein HYZ28_08805 [Myxococcales bacterium]|nr:hypothetical protein [Myxococcales bacterium]